MTSSRECQAVNFFVCSDHQRNTKNISTKFHEKMLNRSQEKEDPKKLVKITYNVPSPGVGDRCESFKFVTTSAMLQRSISKVSGKNIQSFSKNGGTYLERDRQTDKLQQAV